MNIGLPIAISVGQNAQYCVNMNKLQERYLKSIAKLNDMIHGTSSKQRNIQLPKIKLPVFNGEPTNWRAFKDIFDKIVHKNDGIDTAIKIQYLKTNLTGKAAKMVEHLPRRKRATRNAMQFYATVTITKENRFQI